MDEATPHLHIDFVPYTTGSKRGLETRVSLKKALAELGFKGGTRSETERNQWVAAEKEHLAEIMLKQSSIMRSLLVCFSLYRASASSNNSWYTSLIFSLQYSTFRQLRSGSVFFAWNFLLLWLTEPFPVITLIVRFNKFSFGKCRNGRGRQRNF